MALVAAGAAIYLAMRKGRHNEPSRGHELSNLVPASNQPPGTMVSQKTLDPSLDPSLAVTTAGTWCGPTGGIRYDHNKSDRYQPHTTLCNYCEPNRRNPRRSFRVGTVILIHEAVEVVENV